MAVSAYRDGNAYRINGNLEPTGVYRAVYSSNNTKVTILHPQTNGHSLFPRTLITEIEKDADGNLYVDFAEFDAAMRDFFVSASGPGGIQAQHHFDTIYDRDNYFNPDRLSELMTGLEIFLSDDGSGFNLEYANVNTDISTQETNPFGVAYHSDLNKLYMVGAGSDTIYRYTTGANGVLLLDAYSIDISSQNTNPRGLAIHSGLNKLYMLGNVGDLILRYSIDVNGDLTYDNYSFTLTSIDNDSAGLAIDTLANKLYTTGDQNSSIYRFSIDEVGDITYDNYSFDVSAIDVTPQDIAINTNARKMYVVCSTTVAVHRVSIDLNNQLSNDNVTFDVSDQDTAPRGLAYNGNNNFLYLTGRTTDTIFSYSVDPGDEVLQRWFGETNPATYETSHWHTVGIETLTGYEARMLVGVEGITDRYIPRRDGEIFTDSALRETDTEIRSTKTIVAPTGSFNFDNSGRISSNSRGLEFEDMTRNIHHNIIASAYSTSGSAVPVYPNLGVLQEFMVQTQTGETSGNFAFTSTVATSLDRIGIKFVQIEIEPDEAGTGVFSMRHTDATGFVIQTATTFTIAAGDVGNATMITLENPIDLNNGETVYVNYSGPALRGTMISGSFVPKVRTMSHNFTIDPMATEQYVINALANVTDEDAIHDNVAGEIVAITQKTTPVNADIMLIEDSADSNNKKRITLGSLPYPAVNLSVTRTLTTVQINNNRGANALITGATSNLSGILTAANYNDYESVVTTALRGGATGLAAELVLRANPDDNDNFYLEDSVHSNARRRTTVGTIMPRSLLAELQLLDTNPVFIDVSWPLRVVNTYDMLVGTHTVTFNGLHRSAVDSVEVEGGGRTLTTANPLFGILISTINVTITQDDADAWEAASTRPIEFTARLRDVDSNTLTIQHFGEIQVTAAMAGIDSDAIHDNIAGEIDAITEKTTPVDADLLLIEDSADSNNKKKIEIGNLPNVGQVHTVIGGTNIRVDSTDAANPTVNAQSERIHVYTASRTFGPDDDGTFNVFNLTTAGTLTLPSANDVPNGYGLYVYSGSGTETLTLAGAGSETVRYHIGGGSASSATRALDVRTTFYVTKIDGAGVGNIRWDAVLIGRSAFSAAGMDTTAIHDNIAGEIAAITAKTVPHDDDILLIEDSQDSNNKKSTTVANIKTSTINDVIDDSTVGHFTTWSSREINREKQITVIPGNLIPTDNIDHFHRQIWIASQDRTITFNTGTTFPYAWRMYVYALSSSTVTIDGTATVNGDTTIRPGEYALIIYESSDTFRVIKYNEDVVSDSTISAFTTWSSNQIARANQLVPFAGNIAPSGNRDHFYRQIYEATADRTITLNTGADFDYIWYMYLYANGGDITISGTATVSGETTIPDGTYALVVQTGADNYTVIFQGATSNTNLGLTRTADDITITSSTGDDVTVSSANITQAGSMTSSHVNALNASLRTNAPGQIVGLTEKTTPVAADVLLIEDSADSNNKKRVRYDNLEAHDPDAFHDNVSQEFAMVPAKATPTYNDQIIIEDSEDSFNKKRVSFGKAHDGDAIHDNVDGEFALITEKTTPVGNDTLLIEDSEAQNGKRRIKISSIGGTDNTAFHNNIPSEIATLTGKSTPADADIILLEDSEDNFNKKRLSIGSLSVADQNAIHDNIANEIAQIPEKALLSNNDIFIIEDVDDNNNKKRATRSAVFHGFTGFAYSDGAGTNNEIVAKTGNNGEAKGSGIILNSDGRIPFNQVGNPDVSVLTGIALTINTSNIDNYRDRTVFINRDASFNLIMAEVQDFITDNTGRFFIRVENVGSATVLITVSNSGTIGGSSQIQLMPNESVTFQLPPTGTENNYPVIAEFSTSLMSRVMVDFITQNNNYAISQNQNGHIIRHDDTTAYTYTLNSGLLDGTHVYIDNRSSQSITLSRSGSETVEGNTSYVIDDQILVYVIKSGTDWKVLPLEQYRNSLEPRIEVHYMTLFPGRASNPGANTSEIMNFVAEWEGSQQVRVDIGGNIIDLGSFTRGQYSERFTVTSTQWNTLFTNHNNSSVGVDVFLGSGTLIDADYRTAVRLGTS